MPLRILVQGELGSIAIFLRANGRCPATDFQGSCTPKMWARFKGSFDAVTKMGARYQNRERFTPLRDPGKPLWEFKEHDHRLYAIREQIGPLTVRMILLNGWMKDKAGKSNEEKAKVKTALGYYAEYTQEKKN